MFSTSNFFVHEATFSFIGTGFADMKSNANKEKMSIHLSKKNAHGKLALGTNK
jgi:hypothetical protein